MQKEDIRKIVRDVLSEKGLRVEPAERASSKSPPRRRQTPTVLSVFHPGVRKLEQALDQVRLIETAAARSSVFTVDSARQWVCGDDVKEKAGSRCILDTVKLEGLEKVLARADILVLPTFCFKTAAKVARLIGDDQASGIVVSALIAGKPVLAASDGFTLYEGLVNESVRREIDRILAKLEHLGMVFCETEQLFEVFKSMTSGRSSPESGKGNKTAESGAAPGLKLVTVRDIQTAVNKRQQTIRLAPGGIVTPLARDQARENAIGFERVVK